MTKRQPTEDELRIQENMQEIVAELVRLRQENAVLRKQLDNKVMTKNLWRVR
jgi:hypothetical protein